MHWFLPVDVVRHGSVGGARSRGLRGISARLVAQFQRARSHLTSNVLLVSLYRSLFEEKEKAPRPFCLSANTSAPKSSAAFLVNPQLVEPKKTEITVMFSDIRGFTTISENSTPRTWPFFSTNTSRT